MYKGYPNHASLEIYVGIAFFSRFFYESYNVKMTDSLKTFFIFISESIFEVSITQQFFMWDRLHTKARTL